MWWKCHAAQDCKFCKLLEYWHHFTISVMVGSLLHRRLNAGIACWSWNQDHVKTSLNKRVCSHLDVIYWCIEQTWQRQVATCAWQCLYTEYTFPRIYLMINNDHAWMVVLFSLLSLSRALMLAAWHVRLSCSPFSLLSLFPFLDSWAECDLYSLVAVVVQYDHPCRLHVLTNS